MIRTRAELQAAIDVVRNETAVGGNTRDRVATLLQDIVDSSAITFGSTTAFDSTPINPGAGTLTLWSRAIGASIDIEVEVRAHFSNAAGERWIGTLACVAKRVGSGALVIVVQLARAPWILDDAAWAPVFEVSGNTLRLRMTADATAGITPRGEISYRETDTSGDPILT